jgi:suppressor of G2 allele of SKP1
MFASCPCGVPDRSHTLLVHPPLQNFFKSIFAQGDEDTRRAMMKSFVESNGTVLSTNWKEVGAKKIECTPPEGMEVHKWSENM